MKILSLLTLSVTNLFLVTTLSANSAEAAGQKELSYYTTDTTSPMTEYQIQSLCSEQADHAQATLSKISTRLTGSANSLQVQGYYGQQSAGNSPSDPTVESYCYLTFQSNTPTVLFTDYSAVHYTGLTNSTWGTACKSVYDTIAADPNTVIDDYLESASLFQGLICEVTTVQVVPQ